MLFTFQVWVLYIVIAVCGSISVGKLFFNENVWILIKISLKFVPRGPINNIPSLG